MTVTVTLLMSSGDPDPWTLSPEQELEFRDRLAAPVPSVEWSARRLAAPATAG